MKLIRWAWYEASVFIFLIHRQLSILFILSNQHLGNMLSQPDRLKGPCIIRGLKSFKIERGVFYDRPRGHDQEFEVFTDSSQKRSTGFQTIKTEDQIICDKLRGLWSGTARFLLKKSFFCAFLINFRLQIYFYRHLIIPHNQKRS